MALGFAVACKADVRMPAIFADHMVLQQGANLPVWGWAGPGEKVTVQFATQTAEAVADEAGNWRVVLKPVVSDQPLKMTIKARNTIEINDILMGEVWVCSGQSNMGFRVEEALNAEAEIAAANYPRIRHFQMERKVCPEPDRMLGGDWQVCSPATVGQFSAVGYFFARDLFEKLNVPIGLVHASWGGTPAEAWTGWQALEGNPKLKSIIESFERACKEYPENKKNYDKAMQAWEKKAQAAKAAGGEPPPAPYPPMGPTHFQRPSGLYNGMILSIVPYAIRGVIWYQGECNVGRACQYHELLSTMIENWRDVWGQGDFPFYIVQIANWGKPPSNPNQRSLGAILREAQARVARELPNCALAVTIDIGGTETVGDHPKNKQDVGKRLALCALAKTYGEKNLVYSGPVYKGMKVENGAIRLRFDHVDGGLVGDLKGFAIAGKDLIFEWADARIEGDTILLSSPKVPDPVAVRYGWADNPPCGLYNKAGLPAVPFRAECSAIKTAVAVADTYIDQRRPETNYGNADALRIEDDGKPGGGKLALIKWDLSGLDGKAKITDVILRVIQTDGDIGDGIDVYAIQDGDWNESTLTWNRWAAVKPKLVFLGTMKAARYPSGISTFSSPALTAWVRDWIGGRRRNHGLLFKYHHDTVYTGDTFAAHTDSQCLDDPPLLVICGEF